ncbi:Flp pilus assembly complex ATPase component TadA [candidate division NPL-UPA2 bacterium]|nr:Flp pilus assembly complex ATPase component TadA [candidate division NPL-UPA2 bacterium]
MPLRQKKRLGDILLEASAITKEQLMNALGEQKASKERLGKVLVNKGYISEEKFIETLEKQLNISHVNLNNLTIEPEVVTSIPLYLAQRHQVIPIKKEGRRLTLAMADPLNVIAVDDITMLTNFEVIPVIAGEAAINRLIDQYFGLKESMGKNVINITARRPRQDEDFETARMQEMVDEAPIVKVVNSIIQQAVSKGASDIHIEPREKGLRIRLRVDGLLQDLVAPAKEVQPLIISRIKIMCGMDIAEKRLPQDGRIVVQVSHRDINMRVSTLPAIFGEKVVLRLLDKEKIIMPLKKLGFSQYNEKLFYGFTKVSQGMVLVTGPTGCGKSTTLYSALNHLNSIEKNIITVEDPVEYHLEGINQVQVNAKIGLEFGNILRTILRQDPDIIMIGEMRDRETAEIATKAALTGHLVFSTLHSNDAPRAITRLLDMGVEDFLIASSVIGVVSQRLVRKICSFCKKEYRLSVEEEKLFRRYQSTEELPVFYVGQGCSQCSNTGYKGRLAIHEVIVLTEKMREIILSSPSVTEVTRQAQEDGLIPLQEDGIKRVAEGLTTVAEIVRVAFAGI